MGGSIKKIKNPNRGQNKVLLSRTMLPPDRNKKRTEMLTDLGIEIANLFYTSLTHRQKPNRFFLNFCLKNHLF